MVYFPFENKVSQTFDPLLKSGERDKLLLAKLNLALSSAVVLYSEYSYGVVAVNDMEQWLHREIAPPFKVSVLVV